MKTKVLNLFNSMYKLVIDEPGVNSDNKAVLARMSLHEATGCWTIEDVRLSKYGMAHPSFSVGAGQYWASFNAKTSQEADFVRSILREFKESPLVPRPGSLGANPDGVSFGWCTYNGLVPGVTSEELVGHSLILVNGAPLFHGRKEALSHLKSIAEFWEAWPHNAADIDIIEKASAVKIDNPALQPSTAELSFEVARMVREAIPRAPTVAALNSTPSTGHAPSSASSIFSCVTDEHLHGFTPVARFGRLVRPSDNNADLKLPHHADRKNAIETFHEDWLLLEKAGELFVDCIKGIAWGRGYGLDPKAPRLVDISLPSPAYDFFKSIAGPLWDKTNPVTAVNAESEEAVLAPVEVAIRSRKPR